MFGIHRGFSRLLFSALSGGLFVIVIGLGLIWGVISDILAQSHVKGWYVLHSRTGPLPAGGQIAFSVVGAFCIALGMMGIIWAILWLRRASRLMHEAQPVPVLVTFHSDVFDFGRKRGRYTKLFATLHLDGKDITLPSPDNVPLRVKTPVFRNVSDSTAMAIANIRIMTGTQTPWTRYPCYQEAPGLAYLDPNPSVPVVINVNEQYWCSAPATKRPPLTPV